jgi:hypothetical protein
VAGREPLASVSACRYPVFPSIHFAVVPVSTRARLVARDAFVTVLRKTVGRQALVVSPNRRQGPAARQNPNTCDVSGLR